MSLIRACHFDSGTIPDCISINRYNDIVASNTTSRTGSYSLRLNGNAASLYCNAMLNFPLPGLSEFYFQVAFYFVYSPTQDSIILSWLTSDGTVLGGIKLNSTTLKLDFYTGNFSTLVGTSTTAFSNSTWYVLELYIKIDDSGTFSCRINSELDVSISCDTKPGSQTTVSQLRFSNIYYGSSSAYIYWDDIILNDTSGSFNNSWPNCAKVYYLPLTGDGATKQWENFPAGLTHYTSIDEVPPSSSDYIRAATTNLVDIFTCENLPAAAGSIKAVIPEVYAFKGSLETPTSLDIGVDVGGGPEYVNTDLKIIQTQMVNIFEEKPGGGLFSVADVNDIQLCLKSSP